jgi:hypothetical protein
VSTYVLRPNTVPIALDDVSMLIRNVKMYTMMQHRKDLIPGFCDVEWPGFMKEELASVWKKCDST